VSVQGKVRHIPVFVPHMGCPHTCVFCDQRTISGQACFDLAGVPKTIEHALATIQRDRTECIEIAYFGGSFTAIDPDLMFRLLDIAKQYVDAGLVDGIRFSTRPDAIPPSLLDALRAYPVHTIELGLQSMDDAVLAAARRGHTSAEAADACRRIVAAGFRLTGQMMLGLPQSTPESERMTASLICALGAHEARIYPTVVLKGTALETAMRCGAYTPLTLTQAVSRAAEVKTIFDQSGVQCLRIGLCENEALRTEQVVGGAHHPALGELVLAAQYMQRMQALLSAYPSALSGKTATFTVSRGKRSQAIGQKKENVIHLCEQFCLRDICIRESELLPRDAILLEDVRSYT
jgi:histone acetyltransferase (RNA polymerase elongator complex component)